MWKAATYLLRANNFSGAIFRPFSSNLTEIQTSIMNHIKAIQGVAIDKVTPTASMKEINVDSLALIEMFSTLESEFNVSIGEEDAEGVKTIEDLAKVISKKMTTETA